MAHPDPYALPWTPPDREATPEDWRRAEAGLARLLAEAAEALGRLTVQIDHAPEGARDRLILDEVAGLLRQEGVWIGPERLALHRAGALPHGADAPLRARADWAVRRLTGGPDPLRDPATFLGRRPGIGPDRLSALPPGPAFTERAALWQAGVAALDGLHPLSRAGAAHALWRGLGLSPPGARLEGAVAAARTLDLPLVPLGALPRPTRETADTPAEALADWLGALRDGARAASLTLGRLRDWQARAGEATADLSGRTPPRLIAALAASPALTAGLAAKHCGVSEASCQRAFARLQARGLVREITGQSRFRFWTAAL